MDSKQVASPAQGLELIRAGLAALAACDVDAYGSAGLGAECEQLLRAVGGLQREVARRLARFKAIGGPASDGAHSLAGWLGHRARLRPWEAKQLAITASRLHLLDEALGAFDSGEVEFGDVATIAEGIDKAADTLTDGWTPEKVAEAAQPILLEAATSVTPGQLRKAAARIALTLDGDRAERRRRQLERQSYLDIAQTMDGVGVARADMAATDFAILEKAVDAFAPRPDPDLPHWQNAAGHRRLRGLITACEVALRAAGRFGYRERGGAPVKVHVITSAATVDPGVPASDAPPGRTEFGTIVSAAEIRAMMRRHNAEITTIGIRDDGSVADRFTADGRPLNWGRTRRLFTAAQREIFLALYAGCAADGCDRPIAWTAIDHKTEWAAGGRTDLDNGQPLCDWHNLHKEHQRLTRQPGTQRNGQGTRPPDRTSGELPVKMPDKPPGKPPRKPPDAGIVRALLIIYIAVRPA